MSAAERRWSLAAAISSIAVFGIGIGIAGPLASLILEARGTDSSLNGFNAGVSFLGVLVGPLAMPRLVARFGFKHLLLVAIPASVVLFLLLKPFDNLWAWFVLRFFAGFCGSAIFAATEAWISTLADDRNRGRIFGIYAAVLSAGFACGPLVLSLTGIAGWAPFLACAAIDLIAMLPLFAAPSGGGKSEGTVANPLTMMTRMKPVVLIVILFGAYEGGTVSLLAVWGERTGLSTATAATLLSAVFVGAILLQIPVGVISDRFGRAVTLRLCAAFGLLGAALLPLLAADTPALLVALVIWGGFTTGLYPVALGMIGDRYHGGELMSANAGLVIAYGIGAFLGPILGGAAMDAWNPHGVAVLIAAMFALLLAMTWIRGGIAPPTPASSTRTTR